MPTVKELEAKLETIQRLRRITEMQEELNREPTTGQKAWQDIKGFGAGMIQMAGTDPKTAGADFAAQNAIAKAYGEEPVGPIQAYGELAVGPSFFKQMAAFLAGGGGPSGVVQAGIEGAKEIEKHPVLAPLEMISAGLGAKYLAGRANKWLQARRKPPTPLLEYKPDLSGLQPEAQYGRPAQQGLRERPLLPPPDDPTLGKGFTMRDVPSPAEGVARARPKPVKTTPKLIEHRAAPQLEGPVFGPEGPNQFIYRKPPVNPAILAAEKAHRVQQAVRKAQQNPKSAPQAFRELTEWMTGDKKLSPVLDKGYQLEGVGVLKAPRVKSGKIVGAQKPRKAAVEMRPEDAISRKSTTAARIAGGTATAAATATLLEPVISDTDDPVQALMGSLGAIRGAFSAIGRTRAGGFLREARSRFVSPYAKELVDNIEYKADPIREAYNAKKLSELDRAGFKNMGYADRKGVNKKRVDLEAEHQLADRLEHKLPHTPLSMKVEGMFKSMLDDARAVGLKLGEVTDGYFRRHIRDEVAQPIFDDLAPLQSKYEMMNISDDAIHNNISQLIKDGQLGDVTGAALKHLVDTQQAKNLAVALRGLRRETGQSLFAEAGWEKARKWDFSKLELDFDFYERDARKVVTRYVESWSKRMAEAEVFGAKGEVARDLIGKAADYGVDEARFAQHVLDAWSGDIEFKKPLPSWAKKWSNRYTAFAALTKIGGGFATLKNVFQLAISTASHAGWARALEGIYLTAVSPEHRAMVQGSGALNRLAREALTGYMSPSKSSRMADFGLKATGFHDINVFNQYASGITAAKWIPELHQLANGKATGWYNRMLMDSPWLRKQRMAWAQDNLKRMGVDYKRPLDQRQMDTGIYRFTTDSQLQRNVVRDPLNRSDPRFRSLWTLKGFGVRQFHYQKNLILNEAIRHKNFFPLMRLGVGGVAAGYVEQKIEGVVRSWLSGRPPKKSDLPLARYWFNNLAAIGAWSFVTDLAAAENKLQAARFIVTPIQIAEFEKGVQMLERVWADADMNSTTSGRRPMPNKTVGEIAQSRLRDLGAFGGTFTREIAKRGMTEDQRKNMVSRELGEAKDKMFRAAMKGDDKSVRRIHDAWLHNWPERPLTYKDIGPKAFADWMIKKREVERRGQVYRKGYRAPFQTIRQETP